MLRGLPEPCIDNLPASIGKSPCDYSGTNVMTVTVRDDALAPADTTDYTIMVTVILKRN